VAELEELVEQTLFLLEAQHQFDLVPASIKPGYMPARFCTTTTTIVEKAPSGSNSIKIM
jgi:hypothetical protein